KITKNVLWKESSCFFVSSRFLKMALVRELLQKSQIILVYQPDVLHLIAQNRNALDAEAPREARVLFRVVAYRFEDRRVHHAAAEDLDPAAALAHRAAGAVARPAADGDLGARLAVREGARAQADARALAEHGASPREQRALEIRERDP